FVFSSRRRHTSFSRDWSSDVCSSDLLLQCPVQNLGWIEAAEEGPGSSWSSGRGLFSCEVRWLAIQAIFLDRSTLTWRRCCGGTRSEERRVGSGRASGGATRCGERRQS